MNGKSIWLGLFFLLLYPTIQLQAQPDESVDYYVKAEILRQSNQPAAAIVEYDNAIMLDSTQYKYFFNKAKCYVLLKSASEAIVGFEKSLQLKPDLVQAHTHLAWLYQQTENYDKAIHHFDMAFENDAEVQHKIDYKGNIIKLLYKMDKFSDAGRHIADAKEVAPNNLHVLYQDAKYHNIHHNYRHAKQSILKVLSMLPSNDVEQNAKYYYELGYACYYLHEYKDAAAAFQKADYGAYKGLVSKFTPLYQYQLAVAYYRVFHYQEAKAAANLVLEMNTDLEVSTKTRKLLVQISQNEADLSEVISHEKSVVAIERDNLERAAKLQQICEWEYEAGRYKDAIHSAEECLKLKPDASFAKFIKALSLYRLEHHDEAIGMLSSLVNSDIDAESKAEYLLALGLAYKNSGDLRSAFISFRECKALPFKCAAETEITLIDMLDPNVSKNNQW